MALGFAQPDVRGDRRRVSVSEARAAKGGIGVGSLWFLSV